MKRTAGEAEAAVRRASRWGSRMDPQDLHISSLAETGIWLPQKRQNGLAGYAVPEGLMQEAPKETHRMGRQQEPLCGQVEGVVAEEHRKQMHRKMM